MKIKYILGLTIFSLSNNVHSMYRRDPIVEVICLNRDDSTIYSALEPYKSKINTRTKHGSFPLILAVHCGKEHATSYFLQNGANPNAKDSDGRMALHFLAERADNLKYIKKYTDLAELLIAYGANPYLGDYLRRPIDEARFAGHRKMTNIFESVYRWRNDNDLRKTWVTASVMAVRQLQAPVVNTCTAIVPYMGPKSN